MKKVAVLAALSLLALLMVLPITSFVNQTIGNPVLNNRSLRADGNPLPIPPKKLHAMSGTLVADGNPLPIPPKKLHNAFDSLVAGARVSA